MTKKNKRQPQTTAVAASPVKDSYTRKIKPKAPSVARKDIADWKAALRQANRADAPKRVKLIELYNDIMLDSLLLSQIDQRYSSTIGSDFVIEDSEGKEHEEATALLRSSVWMPVLLRYILESISFGHSLIEFRIEADNLKIDLIPRQNVIPNNGTLLFDIADDKGLFYRNQPEYGTWVLEFGEHDNLGILNSAVPHVLFKKFAHACWSELCEIYGIPPRYIKTNTNNPDMLNRAEAMMRDMGSAAWWVIDNSEELQFAQGVTGNGDVYSNLINACNSEISMLISGAQIGQDTKNGNRSKEETSVKQLEKKIKSDKKYVEDYMNSLVLPALYRIGIVPVDGLTFKFSQEEDLEKLWKMVTEAGNLFDIDPEWVQEKFGIQIKGPKQQQSTNLSTDSFFA